MHATDPLLRNKPDTTIAPDVITIPTGELSPEQLAALANSFRNAVQGNDAPAMLSSTPQSRAPAVPHSGPASPESVVFSSDDFLLSRVRTPETPTSLTASVNSALTDTPERAPVAFVQPTPPAPSEAPTVSRSAELPVEDTPSLGTTVLESMQQQSRQAAAVPAESSPIMTATPAARIEKIEQIVAETVSRVLVSDPLHDGRREVRVSLQPDVLPQTDIRLWRESGRLHVEFISTPATLEQSRLADHLPRLADAIHQRQPLGEIPAVSISIRPADTHGQPGDGRSRQQYQPLFEDDAQA